MAEVAPRADAERTASFVRGLYDEAIREERRSASVCCARASRCACPRPTPASATRACACARQSRRAMPPRRSSWSRRRRRLSVTSRRRAGGRWRRRRPGQGAAERPLRPSSNRSWRSRARRSRWASTSTGRVIDSRYRVLRKIGEGGMGTVYAGRARRDRQGRSRSRSCTRTTRAEQELVERFRREARAASRIGHPNIIDVTDFGTTEDGCAYFVMEHLDGIDLADVLSHERRLDPDAVVRDHDPDLPRAGGGARGRRHPPRPQAREHLPGGARRQGRLRQGARLRHRAQRWAHEPAPHQPRHRDGDAGVHGARAGRGRRDRSAAATSTRSARCSTRW